MHWRSGYSFENVGQVQIKQILLIKSLFKTYDYHLRLELINAQHQRSRERPKGVMLSAKIKKMFLYFSLKFIF